MAAFDWYQATVPVPVNDLLEGLSELDPAATLKHGKGFHSYAREVAFEGSEGTLAKVWYGGGHQPYPHVLCTSAAAQAGAELIRAKFPKHSVTRVDACEDFADADAYDRILEVMLAAAVKYRVKVGCQGDHLVTMKGRSVNLGASSSAVQLQLYDKAEQMRLKFRADPVRLASVPLHMARFEARVRPQRKREREMFATVEPVAVMGSAPWLREAWRGVTAMELEPLQVGKPWRQSDDERAYAQMLTQYGGVIRRVRDLLGSWECFGLQCGHDLDEFEKAKRVARGLS